MHLAVLISCFDLPVACVNRNISAHCLLVLLSEVVDNMVVEIFTTKVGITSGSQHFKDTVV